MKITYPGHANVLVEGRLNFMCDPWLVGPHVANCSVWFYPPRRTQVEDLPKLDFIFISHDHHDHCNANTIKALPKNIPYYILDFPNNHDIVLKRLKACGAQNINVIPARTRTKISDDAYITIYKSDEGFIDSAAIIEIDGRTLLHVNDCVLAKSTYAEIGEKNSIDIAFLPYAGFSGFPGMYEFPDEIKKKFAEQKKLKLLQDFFTSADALKTTYAVPAAGDLVILKKGFTWLNYYDRSSPDEVLE